MNDTDLLSIIIPVHNNWNFTQTAIKDLSRLKCSHEIIIVDNNSADKTKTAMAGYSFSNTVRYEPLTENTGFAHACNHGFLKSYGNYVMFLNNDIKVKIDFETWTDPLIEAADAGAIVGPTGGLLDSNFNFIKETDQQIDSKYFYMSGWNMTAKKEIFDKLVLPNYKGPFSEEFGKAYFEDTDLSYRASELDIPLKIVPAPVHHFGKMTSKKLNTLSLYAPAKQRFIDKWRGRI